MLKDVIAQARQHDEKPTGISAAGSDIKISENNFHKAEPKKRRMAFVDGGNSPIITTASYCLHFVRAASLILDEKKKIKISEFFSSTTVLNAEKGLYSTKIDRMKGEACIDFNTSGIAVEKCGEVARRLAEIRIAIDAAKSGVEIVVMDGNLEAQNELEKKNFQELAETAEKNNVVVCSVAKTCTMLTNSGHSMTRLLDSMRKGRWYYFPFDNSNRAFARLNASSGYVFLIEVLNKNDLEFAISALMDNSKDLSFPGYCYGLILADRLARVGNSETDYLKTRIHEHSIQGVKSVNAHSVLDNL